MVNYRFLEDEALADVCFEAFGADVNEVFTNAAYATADTLADIQGLEKKVEKKFDLEANELDLLLYDLLAEIIFFKDAEQLLFSEFEINVEQGETPKLTCIAKGEKLSAEKHTLRNDVKAVTMHELSVKEQDDGSWKAKVILDI